MLCYLYNIHTSIFWQYRTRRGRSFLNGHYEDWYTHVGEFGSVLQQVLFFMGHAFAFALLGRFSDRGVCNEWAKRSSKGGEGIFLVLQFRTARYLCTFGFKEGISKENVFYVVSFSPHFLLFWDSSSLALGLKKFYYGGVKVPLNASDTHTSSLKGCPFPFFVVFF